MCIRDRVWIEQTGGVFPVIALVLILRSFIFEPFQIPSGSMMPTLLVGDFILVEKFAYGLKAVSYTHLDVYKRQAWVVAR